MKSTPTRLAAAVMLAATLTSPTVLHAQQCPQQWQLDRGGLFDHTNAPLTEISGLVVNRRGTAFVAEEKSSTIYVFASDGTLAGSFSHPARTHDVQSSVCGRYPTGSGRSTV